TLHPVFEPMAGHWVNGGMNPLLNRQLVSQPSPLTRLPSSHCSTPTLTTPSPQTLSMQFVLQASLSFPLPSSHCSPAVTMPLPQPVGVQFESQPSPSIRLPSSHGSPISGTPLPQTPQCSPQTLTVS